MVYGLEWVFRVSNGIGFLSINEVENRKRCWPRMALCRRAPAAGSHPGKTPQGCGRAPAGHAGFKVWASVALAPARHARRPPRAGERRWAAPRRTKGKEAP